MKQVVIDLETTGVPCDGAHRVIELAGVEIVDGKVSGRCFHQYFNPEINIDPRAADAHGITDEYVSDKPLFSEMAEEFCDFIDGANLVAHNAPFDLEFINHELRLLDENHCSLEDKCAITDTLTLSKEMFPDSKNNLDCLIERYGIDVDLYSNKEGLTGALLDASY